MKIIAWDREKDIAISPERFPSESEWALFTEGTSRVKKEYHVEVILEEPEVKIRQITKRAFLQRLTQPERTAIRKSLDDIVIDIYEDLKLAEFVDLDLKDTIDGLGYMASIGLLDGAKIPTILRDGEVFET